jgi:hypothetical protein
LDSEILRGIYPGSNKLRNGAWLLSDNRDEAFALYEQLKNKSNVFEFKKGKIGKVNEWLTNKEAKAHPVWKVLARDQTLLDDYVDYIFAEGRKRFDYHIGMGIYPDSAGSNVKMKAWCVSRLGYKSNAIGRHALDYHRSHLLGIIRNI